MLPCTVEDRVILAGGVVVYVALCMFLPFLECLTVGRPIPADPNAASSQHIESARAKAAACACACAAQIEQVSNRCATAFSYVRTPGFSASTGSAGAGRDPRSLRPFRRRSCAQGRRAVVSVVGTTFGGYNVPSSDPR